jgi:serine protease Do
MRNLKRLALVTSTIAGLGAAMIVPGAVDSRANFLSTPALAKNVNDEAKKSAARGWLGVQIQSMTPEIAESLGLAKAEGALIAEPQPNSPASKAGLQAGDVIASVDGTPVKDAAELARKIAEMTPGATIKLGIMRKGAEQTMTATLAEMAAQREARAGSDARKARTSDEPRIGLMVAPAESAKAGSQGVVITGIDPDGIAAGQGFVVGDVILEVAGQAVSSVEDVRKALADARGSDKKNVLMRVKSGEITKFVAVPLARA